MSNLDKRLSLDRIANSVFIVSALFLLAVLARNFAGSVGWRGPTDVALGDTLVPPAGWSWEQSPRTLVLALAATCQYCEASAPLYRRLDSLSRASGLGASLLVTFSEQASIAADAMRRYGLNAPHRAGVTYFPWRLSGTPTILLVGRSGRVLAVWRGLLDTAASDDLIELVAATTPSAALASAP